MAFYADLYGYISKKDFREIPLQLIEEISITAPIFKPVFSAPVEGKTAFYVPFACSLKIDEGEEYLWLKPFEALLRRIDFIGAAVNFAHEEASHIILFTYAKNSTLRRIQKTHSKLVEEFVEESFFSL